MKTLNLASICGCEVLSRANVRKIYEIISNDIEEIDFGDVEFLSRSAADELCNIADNFPSVKFINMKNNVSEMVTIVGRGRKAGRRRIPRPAVSTTYYCTTMQDLKNVLSHGL